MAESGLSAGYPEFRARIGDFLGIGRDPASVTAPWSNTDIARVDEIINQALRRVLGHYDWGFLKVTDTFSTVAPFTTGTVSSVGTTITLVGGVWPLTAADGELVVLGISYPVASRTSDTVIILDVSPKADFAAEPFELRQRDYQMPDAFGGPLIGDLHLIAEESMSIPLRFVPQARIRDRRAQGNRTGRPLEVSIRPKPSDGTTGQRFEINIWPDVDDVYTIQFKYEQIQTNISTANPFPLGGMPLAQTFMYACLAEAESNLDDAMGLWAAKYQEELANAIRHDQLTDTADWMQHYGHQSPRHGLGQRLTGIARTDGQFSDI